MAYSTIISKKRKLSCGCFDYAFSKNRCKQHATVDSYNRRLAAHNSEEDDESWQNLRDDCDTVFSLYIRHKYANSDGHVKCYTCPKVLPITQMQNGHYISRANLSTRWLENSCRPQCPRCNSNHETDITPFRTALEREQKGLSEWLEEQGREISKPSISDLKQLLSELRHKYELVKKKVIIK